MPALQQTRRISEQADKTRLRRVRTNHLSWLVLAVSLAFLSSLPGSFVWRDHQDIVSGALRLLNSEDWSLLWTSSSDQYRERIEGWVSSQSSGGWQPLLVLNYSLDWWTWGECAGCYRAENVFWHLLTVMGLYALGRHLLYRRRHGKRTAFWAALIFALHPLGVSVVAWSGGRSELLFGAFSVWALVAFSRLPATTASDTARGAGWLPASLLFTAAALLVSSHALLILPATMLLSWFSLRERGRRRIGSIAPERWRAMALIAGIGLLYLTYRIGMIDFDQGAGYPGDSWRATTGTLIQLFWHYIGLVFFPSEPLLSDSWPIVMLGPAQVAALLGIILLLALVAVGVYRSHPVAFGAAWFLLWLLPGSGLFPLTHLYAESQLYPASWGLVFASSHIIMQLWRPLGRQLMSGSEAIALAPLALALTLFTGLSNARWWSDDTLFQSEVDIDPYYLDGRIALAEQALMHNRPQDANAHLLNAMDGSEKRQFTGHWQAARAYSGLSEAHLRLALYQEAKRYAERAIAVAPQKALPWYLLGSSELGEGRIEESLTALQAASERLPNNPRIQARLGAALIMQGGISEGLALLAPHAEIADAQELEALARAAMSRQAYPAAIDYLQRALQREETPQRRAMLAWARWLKGDMDAAREDLRLSLQAASPAPAYVEWVAEKIRESEVGLGFSVLLDGLPPTAAGAIDSPP